MDKPLGLRNAIILLGLPLLLLVTFTHYPLVKSIIDSFWSNSTAIRHSRFVGLRNYEHLLTDDTFIQVMWNSALYAVVTIPATIVLSISMALLVDSKLPGRALMRLSFFLPTMLPMIAIANLWLFIYIPDIGLVAKILSLFGLPSPNLLGDPDTSLWAMMVVAIWKESGLFMIFYLAALQSVPSSLKEAARLEGAGPVKVFFSVVLPMLTPTTVFVAVNAMLNAFRVVEHVIVMTKGGPDNSSSLLLFYIYKITFGYRDFAYGATLTVLLAALLGILALVQFKVLDRKAHYQ
jgi:sn-glycerol 3-phosphate transport system permease protein